MRDSRRVSGFTLVELLLVIGIISILLALTTSAVQQGRMTAARAECANHLKQLGLALHNYQQTAGAFPPGISDKPRWGLSWHTCILPQLEQEPLAAELAALSADHLPLLGRAEADPPNPGLVTWLKIFACPADPNGQTTSRSEFGFLVAPTSYLGNEGSNLYMLDGIFYQGSAVRFTDVLDGTSQTLAVGERPAWPWAAWGIWYSGFAGQLTTGSGAVVMGARERYAGGHVPNQPNAPPAFGFTGEAHFVPGDLTDPYHAFHYWSFHPAGANFLFVDGSVRFLSYSADSVLPALATRAGNEVVSGGDW